MGATESERTPTVPAADQGWDGPRDLMDVVERVGFVQRRPRLRRCVMWCVLAGLLGAATLAVVTDSWTWVEKAAGKTPPAGVAPPKLTITYTNPATPENVFALDANTTDIPIGRVLQIGLEKQSPEAFHYFLEVLGDGTVKAYSEDDLKAEQFVWTVDGPPDNCTILAVASPVELDRAGLDDLAGKVARAIAASKGPSLKRASLYDWEPGGVFDPVELPQLAGRGPGRPADASLHWTQAVAGVLSSQNLAFDGRTFPVEAGEP